MITCRMNTYILLHAMFEKHPTFMVLSKIVHKAYLIILAISYIPLKSNVSLCRVKLHLLVKRIKFLSSFLTHMVLNLLF